MTKLLQKLSTRYAFYVAALLTLLIFFVLLLAGYFVFEHTGKLRDELTSSFSSVHSTNVSQALSAKGAYLSNRLFSPLYNTDISGLNEEIEQIQNWLEPESILVLDSARRVVTDGTDENVQYGQYKTIPNGLQPKSPVIDDTVEGKILYFAIGFGDEVVGYACIELSSQKDLLLLSSLQKEVEDTWRDFQNIFLIIAIIGLLLIVIISVLLARRLAVSLSQPVQAMTVATEQFASGNLTYKLPEVSGTMNELSRLQLSLNEMASKLAKAEGRLRESEEQQTDLLNNTSSVIYIKDLDGRHLFINRMYEKLFHVSDKDMQGKTDHDIFPKEMADAFRANDLKVIAADKLLETEEVAQQNGEIHTYISVKFPLKKDSGESYAICGISTDITEHKKTEDKLVILNEQLVANEAWFKAITNQSTEGITVADLDGNYTFVNDAFCKMLAYSKEELLQMTVFEVKAAEQDTSSFARSKTSKEGLPIRVLLQRKDGTVFNAEVIGKNIEVNGEQSVLGTIRDITEQVQAEERLIKSEKNLAEAQKVAQLGSWELDIVNNELSLSAEAFRIIELDPEEFDASYETFIDAIHPDDREIVDRAYTDSVDNGQAYDIEHRLLMKDGRIKYVNECCETFYDENGKAKRSFGTVFDVTERKLTEQALRRSQKMDAVGQMAGGIAHDFNNIIGIILGNLHMLEKQPELDEKAQKRIDGIKRSASRAANLTKQLLGFSRREPASEKATNINRVISGMSSLITQSLTPQVEVEQQFADDLWKARIDPGDFEDALLNLVLNARDAMNGRGQLTIETRNAVLDEAYCAHNPGAKPGEYVQLAVSDNGEGIASELQDHIFEPFYTTKEQGKGTGLGLAMVFGFVKRSRGYVKLYSEPGIGTTFHLYLPGITEQDESGRRSHKQARESFRGSELLLLVDDEASLLELARESLQAQGYRVITANNGKQALEKLAAGPAVDLLFSDVVMPGGINGFELAEQAKAKYPRLKVLLTSGYSKKVVARNGQARFETNLLNKPYTLVGLAQRVRSLLDEPESGDMDNKQ